MTGALNSSKKKKGKKKKSAAQGDEKRTSHTAVPTESNLQRTLDATSKLIGQYRERISNLSQQNENLQDTCVQQEKDALDVIAALHRDNEKREAVIRDLRLQKSLEVDRINQEKATLAEQYEQRISALNTLVVEKEAAMTVMQQEFASVKDFGRKRQELMKQLDLSRAQLSDSERRHRDTVARMERRFLEEKIRLQKDANSKISKLAANAHREAVRNLHESTREVHRENLRMVDTLKLHVQEGEELGRQNSMLLTSNRQLIEEKDFNDVMVKMKIMQTGKQTREILNLQKKIRSLEHSLTKIVKEFAYERQLMAAVFSRDLEQIQQVTAHLKMKLGNKTHEMRTVRQLARHVLRQRSDVELFFLDALAHVRLEIQSDKAAAQKSMTYPSLAEGSNPQKPNAPNAQVDISELSWYDKEKILRLLFARMNGIALVGKGGGAYTEAAEEANDKDPLSPQEALSNDVTDHITDEQQQDPADLESFVNIPIAVSPIAITSQ